MTFWKAWTDIRVRFYLSAVLVTLAVGPTLVISAVRSAQAADATAVVAPQGGESGQMSAGAWSGAAAFPTAIGEWAHGSEHLLLSVLVMVLAVGGALSQANARSNLMTLSLPTARWRWLVSQWVVASLLVFALSLWISVMFAVLGTIFGLDIPWDVLALAWIASGFSAVMWAWPSMLSTSFTHESLRAALLVVAVMVVGRTVTMLGHLPGWSLQDLADLRQWSGAIPWKPLVLGLAMSALSAGWVLRRFERTDF